MAESRRALLSIAAIILLCGLAYEVEAKPRCVFARQYKSESSDSTRRQRSLLQKNCGFSFGNSAVTFAACQNITSELLWDYNILWDIADAQDGGTNSTFKGAIDVASSADIQWAAFGFPAAGSSEMVGGSAIVVKQCSTCSSGASVDSYYLASQTSPGVQPPGRLTVISMEAALSNGRLQAVFELSLPLAGSQLTSPANTLYAAGPLSNVGGALREHTYYFPGQLNLNDGMVSSLGPAIAPVAAAPTLAPSAAAPQESSAAPSTAIASTSAVSATAPAPAAGTGDCSMEFAGNNSRLAFAQCQSLATSSSANSGIRFLWNLSPSPAGNGSLVTGALEATSPGWAGFGFPSSPGVMQGANVLIVKPCTSCSTGASVDNYLLNGYDSSDVVPGTGKLNVTGLEAAKTSSGALQATFELYLPEGVADLSNPMNLIASVGPVSSSGNLQTHPLSNAYTGSVNLASGSVSIGGGGDNKPTIHGYLMIFGWGLLLPLGVVLARCKEWGPLWFHLHRLTQMLGYLTGMAGAGVAVAMGRKNRTHLENVHRIIGLVVTIVLSIQVLAILWRPHPKDRYRVVFNCYHWVMGGAAVLLACSNVFIGLNIAGEPTKWSGLYGAGFGLIVLMYLGKAALNATVLAGKRRRLIGSSDDSDSLDEREKLGSKKAHANGTSATV